MELPKKQRRLLPWYVDGDGKHFHVVCKIRIRRKDCPLAFDGYCANKDVHNRNDDSLPPAPIASLGSLFVIRCVDSPVRKGAKVETELFIVLRCLDSRKQLLPNQTHQSRPSLSNEFGQFSYDKFLSGVQAFGFPSKCKRPNRSVDQDIYARFAIRSRL